MKKRKESSGASKEMEESDDDMGFGLFDDDDGYSPGVKINQSGTSCTYEVAGLSTITSDNAWHRVSIAVSLHHCSACVLT